MQKLNNEIQQFNKIKKENKNGIKKRIDINANINNAKQNEKKAEHMMNKLLENQKINRGKIYGENKLQIVKNNLNENEQKISDDSLNNFYKDKNDNYEINQEFILNQNEIEENNNFLENKNKKREIKKYEEPIIRDKIPKKEVINRLSPIDLPSYQKVELEEKNEFEHKEPKNKNQIFILNKKEKNVNKYYLEDIPTKVNDFNLLNELQINPNNCNNNNNYINNEMNDVKLFINQMNSNNPKIINNYENNVKMQEIPNDINNNNNIMNKNDNKLEEEKKKKDENKDKKWKYNKQELYERKKKMLKDKSNFK